MKLKLEHLAPLAQRTWGWTGVNDTSIEEWVPAVQPYDALPSPILPQGIDGLLLLPEEAARIQTGLGVTAQQFMQREQNAGEYLQAEKDSKNAAALPYNYVLSEDNPTLVDDNFILAEKNSQITVFQAVTSADEAPAFHAGRTRIIARENAKVRLVLLQMLNENSLHWNDVGAVAEAGAEVEVVQIELGGKRSLAGCRVELLGRQSKCRVEAAYFAHGSRKLDFNHVVRHHAQSTESEITAYGAMFGRSYKNYRGTLDFVSGAAYSVGHEGENILLFSPHARNLSTPVILCGEENVEGMHAATIGKVDTAKMFYLQSRGLSEKQAKRLLLDAQFAPALAAIPNDELRKQVAAYFEERMREI